MVKLLLLAVAVLFAWAVFAVVFFRAPVARPAWLLGLAVVAGLLTAALVGSVLGVVLR